MWAVAQEAEAAGDLPVAARLYRRLVGRRPVSNLNKQANERLEVIERDALTKLDAIVADLKGGEQQSVKAPGGDDQDRDRPSRAISRAAVDSSPPAALKQRQTDPRAVTAAFQAMDELAKEYAGVVNVDKVLTQRINRLRQQEYYAAILNEPGAAELHKFGRLYENKGELCCAYLVYEEAAALAPAPSAKLAKRRFEEMKKDEGVVEAARACRQLQSCHAYYERAEAMLPSAKETAIKYFIQICQIAPADTEVHQAARAQLARLQ
jgi:hypothetical protein